MNYNNIVGCKALKPHYKVFVWNPTSAIKHKPFWIFSTHNVYQLNSTTDRESMLGGVFFQYQSSSPRLTKVDWNINHQSLTGA